MSTTTPRGLTIRSVVIGVALTLFVAAGAAYVSLKLGMLPWPIPFAVLAARGLMCMMRQQGGGSIHEINVAQAGGSVGGLVAAGLCFTIPGILFLNRTAGLSIPVPPAWQLSLIVGLAGLHGVLLSIPLRRIFVDHEQLPYPAGTAGAELLRLGERSDTLQSTALTVGLGAALFSLLRNACSLTTLLPSPLAVSLGFIVGRKTTLWWIAGALLGWCGIPKQLGMGLVLGSGIGFIIPSLVRSKNRVALPTFNDRTTRCSLGLALLSLGALVVCGVPWLAALIAAMAVWPMVAAAGKMTGETNIDPLEQFGIFVGLIVTVSYSLLSVPIDPAPLFLVVLFVSVACAVAGDIGHDYKSAAIIGTAPRDITVIALITVVVAAIAIPWIWEGIVRGFSSQLFTAAMPAPQSQFVAGSIAGFPHPRLFASGATLGFLIELGDSQTARGGSKRTLLMPFGIGLFLGMGIAIPLAVGGVLHGWIKKRHALLLTSGLVLAAAVMGGESIAGFLAGILTAAGLHLRTAATWLMIFAGGLLLMRVRKHGSPTASRD